MAEVWACPACTLHNQPDDSICAACSAARPGLAAEPCDTAPMEAVVKALADVSLQTIGLDDERPKRGTKGFAHLPNGDCMPHALALGTHYLLERRVQSNEEHVSVAAQMRSLLHTHMERRWYGRELHGGRGRTAVAHARDARSQLGCLRHRARAVCVVGQRPRRADGTVRTCHTCDMPTPTPTPTPTLKSTPKPHAPRPTPYANAHCAWHACGRWRSERGQFYCGMPELLALAEMCQEAGGVRIGLRVWRQVAGQLQLMQRVPEPRAGDEQAVVLPHVEMLVRVASRWWHSPPPWPPRALGRFGPTLQGSVGGCGVAARPTQRHGSCSVQHGGDTNTRSSTCS